jgi:hypothetical protein
VFRMERGFGLEFLFMYVTVGCSLHCLCNPILLGIVYTVKYEVDDA